MASLFVRRLFRYFPASQHPHQAMLSSLFFTPLSTQSQQLVDAPFIAQYLVSSLGFPADRALRISTSKRFTAIKFRDRPDSLVSFLKEFGFSDYQIRSLISRQPGLLLLRVDRTIKPKAVALMNAGFTGEKFIQLIISNPQCLYLKGTLSRLQFWMNFVGNSDEKLWKVLRKNTMLITRNIENYIIPRIDILREYRLSAKLIVKLITNSHGLMSHSCDFLDSRKIPSCSLGGRSENQRWWRLQESARFDRWRRRLGGAKWSDNKFLKFSKLKKWFKNHLWQN